MIKTIKMSLAAMLATGTMAMAGGDVSPVVEVEVAPQTKDFYVGLSTTLGDSVAQTDFDAFSSTGYGVQAGYTFYRNGAFSTSVEGRYTAIATGSFSDATDVQTYGAFIKPQYNFDAIGVYGLVGYSNSDVQDLSSDGWAYGIGANYAINDSIEVFADYVVNDDTDFNALQDWEFNNEVLAVGVNYRF